jgi:hypothetical protein
MDILRFSAVDMGGLPVPSEELLGNHIMLAAYMMHQAIVPERVPVGHTDITPTYPVEGSPSVCLLDRPPEEDEVYVQLVGFGPPASSAESSTATSHTWVEMDVNGDPVVIPRDSAAFAITGRVEQHGDVDCVHELVIGVKDAGDLIDMAEAIRAGRDQLKERQLTASYS